MTHFGPSPLPRGAVPPVAIAVAHRAKVIAIIAATLSATCLLLGAADVIKSSSGPGRNDVAALFWVGAFGLAAAFALRRANRATAAARRAAADAGSTWTLVGNLVVAADDRGQPALEHSFKVTRAKRAMLLSEEARALQSQRSTG